MRTPKKKRAGLRKVIRVPAETDLAALAAKVTYIGSPEHKTYPFAGLPPKPRRDASLCDKSFAGREAMVNEWLQEAVRRGTIGEAWDGDFPRYAWHRGEGVCFEARLVNPGLGHYKGYPILDGECPEGV